MAQEFPIGLDLEAELAWGRFTQWKNRNTPGHGLANRKKTINPKPKHIDHLAKKVKLYTNSKTFLGPFFTKSHLLHSTTKMKSFTL